MNTFAAWSTIFIVFAVITLMVQTQLPRTWQTPLSFFVILVAGIPAFFLLIMLISNPIFMGGAIFIFGVCCAAKPKRA